MYRKPRGSFSIDPSVLPSFQSSKRKASVVSWESAKKPRKRLFQDLWKKGRSWLHFDGEAMVCSFCQKHANLSTQCGFKRDAWISGCHRLRLEVVREHEQSKMHRDSESAEQTQRGVITKLAAKLGFNNNDVMKWLKSSGSVEGIAQDILLSWSTQTSVAKTHGRSDLIKALAGIKRRDLAERL